MSNWRCTTLTCAFLSAQANIGTAQVTPGPKDALQARVSWLYSPTKICPDLREAEDGTAAVVEFLVGTSGVPSRPSIKLSSGSEALDAAAINCVLRLRFQPATRLGDGEPMDSWQKIAWRWTSQVHHDGTEVITTPASAPRGGVDSAAVVAAPKENGTVVRVCADETGKLAQDPTILRSSGNAGLDEAALRIARSGSPYYRPKTPSDAKPVSGCARLSIEFETK
jgi:TonB family protein